MVSPVCNAGYQNRFFRDIIPGRFRKESATIKKNTVKSQMMIPSKLGSLWKGWYKQICLRCLISIYIIYIYIYIFVFRNIGDIVISWKSYSFPTFLFWGCKPYHPKFRAAGSGVATAVAALRRRNLSNTACRSVADAGTVQGNEALLFSGEKSMGISGSWQKGLIN